mgnify:CR=1 FL=1
MINMNDIANSVVDFDRVEKELEKISAMANNQKLKWKPAAGQTRIRLVPYIHRLDFPISVFKFHYALRKASWCLSNEGKTCPACEMTKRLSIEGKDDQNEKYSLMAKELRAQERWFAPILVRGKEEEGVKIWAFSKTAYEEILSLLKNTSGKILNIKEGCDLIITYTPAAKGGKDAYAKTKIDIDFNMFTHPQPALANFEELKNILEATPKIETTFPQSSSSEIEEAVASFIDGQSEDVIAEEVEESDIVEEVVAEVKAQPIAPKKKTVVKETVKNSNEQLQDDLSALLDNME